MKESVNLYSGRITPEAQEESEAWEFSKSQHEMKVKINDELESEDEHTIKNTIKDAG